MKKLLFLLAFVPLVSFGQFSKGTKYVGGDLMYYSNNLDYGATNSPSSKTFSTNVQMGFFLNDSWAVGPVVNYISSNRPSINPVTNLFESSKINGFAGGLFARKFFTITDKFFFSLEGKGLIGNLSRDENAAMFNEGGTRLNISLLPAFTFMPNQKWAFDAGIGEISYRSNWYANYINEQNFNINLGQVNLGVNYFFGR